MSDNFLSAVVGAVAGGGIAALLQWLALRHAKRERERGLAYALMFKVIQIHSHLSTVHEYIEKAFENSPAGTNDWQLLQPMANSPSRVTFSTDEIALVLSLKADKTLNQLLSMDELHNATLDSLEFFSKRRLELSDSISLVGLNGLEAYVDLSQLPLVQQAKGAALTDFVKDFREHLKPDALKALNVAQQLTSLFQEKLSVTTTIIPKATA